MKATIRNLFIRSAAPAAAAMALVASAPDADAAAYIKFDGVDGEALDTDHKGWSDLLSFGQAIHRPGSGTGATRRRGDVVLEDIVCTKELDKSSPKIAEAICKGTVFPTVWIQLTKEIVGDDGTLSEQTYYMYELTNVYITSYSVSGATQDRQPDPAGGVAPDPVPVDQVSLNFDEIKTTYTEFDKQSGKKKGNVEYSWKVEEGES